MIDLTIHVLGRERQFPPSLHHLLDVPGQQDLTTALPPSRTRHKGEHDARLIRQIGHASMPQPQVADDQAPTLRASLYRGRMFPALLQQFRPDGQQLLTLVGRVVRLLDADVVRADPNLGPAVLGRHVDEIDVDHVREGEVRRVCELAVRVHRLAAVRRRLQRRVPIRVVDDGSGPQHRRENRRRERVAPQVFEHQALGRRGRLVHVPRVLAKVEVVVRVVGDLERLRR